MTERAGAAGRIRVGIVGTGPITTRFADAVHVTDGIEIAAVFSRDAERGAAAAARLGAGTSLTSLDALLQPGVVDAVYLASPNSVHVDQARQFIEAGKHVLVEKPAVDTAEQWRQLVEQSGARGMVLLEAMRTAYDPGTELVRRLLPRVGQVRQVNLRHISRSARYDLVLAGEQVNIFDPDMGGGALRDLGVYCVYAMTSLFGLPRQVTGAAAVVKSGADGAGAALAQYDDFVVSLEYSKVTSSRLPSQISGEAGTLSIDHIASPRLVELEQPGGAVERHALPDPQHSLVGEVERFVRLIEGDGDASLDQRSTETTLEVLEAIEDSISSGRTHTFN